ncbi:YidC/Oxa1 family membrane protein insertase [Candidatus Saccharibacteria bacterium]|nr:YidC/Oxa1 family membrane protein insertase [Candidatus Saccharibacteria bacterium]
MSVKKAITLIIIVAAITGMIMAGGLFNLLDIIIVRPIVNILFIIFNLVGDFGLAIIIFTIIVKLAMLPLTKRQLHQTKLMRKIQPELAQIKKNCNGNRQLESLQTMDLYKRYNVKPFASILTLLIQLPIFIAIFSAIRVIATPLPTDNLNNRAYEIVAYDGSRIKELKEKQTAYLDSVKAVQEYTQAQKEAEKNTENTEEAPVETTEATEATEAPQIIEYDFHPQLFGVINLEAKASDVLTDKRSWSAFFILICAIAAAFVQYFMTRQQMSSGKSEKSKKFRDLVQDAKDGKEVNQSEVNTFATGQMGKMMPIMMFFIMFNLHGALAFYYFLSNAITVFQQKLVLKKAEEEMDNLADKAILKELKNIQEAEVVENKKTGTKITRISAKDIKKKRR